VNDRLAGLAPSARSTSIEKSIWKVSPLPQPPAPRSEPMIASLLAAGATPLTSRSQNAPAGKYGPPPPITVPPPSSPPHAASPRVANRTPARRRMPRSCHRAVAVRSPPAHARVTRRPRRGDAGPAGGWLAGAI
jgi:hypothetical protein